MNRPSLVPIVILASSIAAFAAPEADSANKQLQVYPKNIARHHVGANVFFFNATSQSYTPTEAAAAWLDDDITSGAAPVAGKQHYLLALSEPEVVTNFMISGQANKGTVTIYAGDEPAVPGAKSWQPVVKDTPLESINGKKLEKPFNRLAKYILLETNVETAAPICGLYLYGERPAVSYQLVKRDKPIDTKAIFGPYTNDLAAISTAGLYAGGRVAFSTEPGNYTSWQKAIDDNPESNVSIISSTDQAGMVLKFRDTQPVTRLAILAGSQSKGKLEVFVVPSLPEDATVAATTPTDATQPVAATTPADATSPVVATTPADATQPVAATTPTDATQPADSVQPVSTTTTIPVITQPVSLTGLTPAATFTFDGSNTRQSQDINGAEGSALLFRWTPDVAGDVFVFSELNAFGGFSLTDYALALSPEAVAELTDASKDGKSFKEGKGLAPVGEELPPVGELFPHANPFLPPALGFPPPIPPVLAPSSP